MQNHYKEMRFLIALLCIAAVCALEEDDTPLITKEFTESVRKMVSWEVVDYEDNIFKDWTVAESKSMLLPRLNKRHIIVDTDVDASLPENFDPRTGKWAKCIHPILNQGKCGSCWAHGSSEVVSDRFCIAGKDVILSPQDLTSCDRYDNGCKGGGITEPFQWIIRVGIVTATCFPYVSGNGQVPACITACKNGESFTKYKCKPGSIVEANSVSEEQKELYENGPVDTGFNVYADFKLYKSGIYEHKSGQYLGGHAVKVIGWGVQDGVRYWICSNSWGTNWGENGFFRIKFGNCDIDGGAACTPLI